jgi:hypothetical protein
MATLQVLDMNDELFAALRVSAEKEGRSISQQVTYIVQQYYSSIQGKSSIATQEFLKLCGEWDDIRSPKEICEGI